MWSSIIEDLNPGRLQKISIFCNSKRVTYSEVIELWQQDVNFRSFFIALLESTPFPAYFWETPPITITTATREFEFVLVDSPSLAKAISEPYPFRQYFSKASHDSEIITFPNLGNDALLVVPCPTAKISAYAHIASFIREAPSSQKHALLQTVGTMLNQRLNQHPIWVSTSGLGVFWLHIRLDSYPKYYNFNPYKIPVFN